MMVELYDDDAQECHECGKIGKPRLLMHLKHLCQHYVALCPECFKRFRFYLKAAAKIHLEGP